MNDFDVMPDPKQIPSVDWMLHHLDNKGDDIGSDYNDSEAIQGYFGWSATTWTNSATGAVRRRELEVWWEPLEEGPGKPKRHIRRFLIAEITGHRGAETKEID
ncbi:MAG TPA: hypothetical protein VJ816_09910 [Gemmatimonadales bacterium]|nr:hypothetical protein [Gemmatimonadales bacterium]